MISILNRLDSLQKNVLLLWSRNAAYSAAFIFGSMTVLQAYLKQVGVNDTSLGLLNTLTYSTQVVVMLLYIGRVDACRDPIRSSTIFLLGHILLPGCLIALCLFHVKSTLFITIAVFVFALLQNIFAGFRISLDGKIYTYLSTQQALGRVVGINGIISGAISVLSGLLLAPVLASMDFPGNIALAFGICMVLVLLSAGLNDKLILFQYQPHVSGNALQSMGSMMKLPQFRKLFLANFSRGIAQAGGYFLLPVGIFRLNLGMKHTSLIVSSTVGAVIIANLLYTLLVKKVRSDKIYFFATVLGAAGFVLLVTVQTVPLYIAACFLVMLSQGFMDNAIFIGNIEIVPREMTGAFSAARISLTYLANALASVVIGWCIGKVNLSVVFMIIAGVLLAGGVIFLIRQHKMRSPQE